MASLKQIIKDNKDEICDSIAWVVIYKEGRSWNAEAFWNEDGSYDDGLVFGAEDYARLNEIAAIDSKAICINGYYMPFGEDFTLAEIEAKVLYFYSERRNQLQGDFLDCMVVKPEHGSMDELAVILAQIKDKVIVTGSYAYGNQTATSDIDMYIKELPEEKIDYETGEDTYCKQLIEYFESLGYEWSSCFVTSFAVDDTAIPLEFSAHYSIEEDTFDIEICGVTMKVAKSTHTSEKYLNGQKRARM